MNNLVILNENKTANVHIM